MKAQARKALARCSPDFLPSELVGCADEMQLLYDVASDVFRRRISRQVFVHGPPGCGKTHFARMFIHENAGANPVCWLDGRVDSMKSAALEVTRALSKDSPAATLTAMQLVEVMHRALLTGTARAKRTAIVVLDNFSEFVAQHQPFLYRLLDATHIEDTSLFILALDANANAPDALEQRIRSRFSPLAIALGWVPRGDSGTAAQERVLECFWEVVLQRIGDVNGVSDALSRRRVIEAATHLLAHDNSPGCAVRVTTHALLALLGTTTRKGSAADKAARALLDALDGEARALLGTKLDVSGLPLAELLLLAALCRMRLAQRSPLTLAAARHEITSGAAGGGILGSAGVATPSSDALSTALHSLVARGLVGPVTRTAAGTTRDRAAIIAAAGPLDLPFLPVIPAVPLFMLREALTANAVPTYVAHWVASALDAV
eukprot:gnl/Chilomastix_cuspidata/3107.p1 GENE.gnl/Chilomastix_cuspidata/3107~~gnl/Chilomastix_cuspidata/3107.p1  ORF type:complete len:432 (-),score=60.35 gnl/Chilomastix_cuspidata/3107:12-1307(-)